MNELASLLSQGEFDTVATRGAALLVEYPSSAALMNMVGVANMRLGRLEAAKSVFDRAVKKSPRTAALHHNLGLSQMQMGQFGDARLSLQNAIKLDPSNAQVYLELANVHYRLGDTEAALTVTERAVETDPKFLAGYYNLGVLQQSRKAYRKAAEAFQAALRISPNSFHAHAALGTVYQQTGELDKARASYEQARLVQPNDVVNLCNFAALLFEAGDLDLATRHLRTAEKIRPQNPQIKIDLGKCYQHDKRWTEAKASFRKALEIDDTLVNAHDRLADSAFMSGEPDLAIEHYKKSMTLAPEATYAAKKLGALHVALGDLDQAFRVFADASHEDPSDIAVLMDRITCAAKMADWEAEDFESLEFMDVVDEAAVSPLRLQFFDDSAKRQFQRSKRYAEATFPDLAEPLQVFSGRRPIRVGFFSANYNEHPIMDLMSGVFREHDRAQFSYHAISYAPFYEPDIADRLRKNGIEFHDASQLSDRAFVEMAKGLDLDIAIDMSGHTAGTKTFLFAHRLAPLQVNYLAYPGTLGSEAFDYLIADPTLIPERAVQHFVEHILWMPCSYLPYDNQTKIAQQVSGRAHYGLPDHGFVFCSFNNSIKITPREFDIWMRLLSEVEGSCLWLTGKNSWVTKNLRKAAEKRKIDPSRLVFSDRVPKDEHLARHRHADLFLDTFNYNAHTTAIEALWTGLPIVTKIGDQFAARVGASLLNAMDLPDLITESDAAYEALALKLAQAPEALSSVRERLNAARKTSPLFNTQKYTRDFESGLKTIWERRLSGAAPTNIAI